MKDGAPVVMVLICQSLGYSELLLTSFNLMGMQAPEVQAADKGVGRSELGTGYEADGEEVVNPAIVPKVTSKHYN